MTYIILNYNYNIYNVKGNILKNKNFSKKNLKV